MNWLDPEPERESSEYGRKLHTMERQVDGAAPVLLHDILGVNWERKYSLQSLMWTTGAAGSSAVCFQWPSPMHFPFPFRFSNTGLNWFPGLSFSTRMAIGNLQNGAGA